MKTWKILAQLFIVIVVIVYAWLYGYTSADKMLDIGKFAKAIAKQAFPAWINWGITWLLPPFEFLIAIFLIRPKWQNIALNTAVGLMFIFTIYTYLGKVRLLAKTACGCAGLFNSLKWSQHFWLNFGLLMGGIVAIVLTHWVAKNYNTI